eukprot:SAG22_NODE_210_length_15092_cov_81.740946_10_plen_199_part_00
MTTPDPRPRQPPTYRTPAPPPHTRILFPLHTHARARARARTHTRALLGLMPCRGVAGVDLCPKAGDFLFCSENLTHGVLNWHPSDPSRTRSQLMLRYDPAFQDGYTHLNRKVLARIAPETRELLQAAAYGRVKAIAQTDVVTLSGSEAPEESSVAEAALDLLEGEVQEARGKLEELEATLRAALAQGKAGPASDLAKL